MFRTPKAMTDMKVRGGDGREVMGGEVMGGR